MSGTPFACFDDCSITSESQSGNNSQDSITSEKNSIDDHENNTIYNSDENIETNSFRQYKSRKDNFQKSFLSLKNDRRNFVKNKCEVTDNKDEKDLYDEKVITSNKTENLLSDNSKNEYFNKEDKVSNGKNLFSKEKKYEKIEDLNCFEEADEIGMKAAFSKVAEHFGLFSPEGNLGSTFYGVYIPNDSSLKPTSEDILHVYTEKSEALMVMKQSKKARLKQFKTRHEAISFAVHGLNTMMQQNSSQCASGGEKVMPFKCPKVQDMISFKKAIENGDIEEVRRKIFDNPRYLVSIGDTPSILQEGSRYNALHIAAKLKNICITRLILESIIDVDFISYLYDDNDVASCKARIEVLLDLYLNMPDKGLNETPLHIAVKHGAVEVVEYLISYPQCQRNLKNKFHQQPKDIICSRVNDPCDEVRNAIAELLEEQYYLPVLRYEDNTIQPRVGEPFSPSKPLNLSEDLLSPRIEIQAYAGPMSKENAELLKKKWKSPPRLVKTSHQPLSLRLRDMEKGLERIGRNLASEMKVPWKEYWAFLDTFVDLLSENGLQTLENYLKKRFEDTLEMVKKGSSLSNFESSEKVLSPISALCEALKFCSLNDDLATPVKKIKWSSWNVEKFDTQRKTDENVESNGKNPLLYVERSCEVFGKRIASAISSSSNIYQLHTDYLKDYLEIQIRHLMSNILSYKEDNRFQSVNFQMIHSRVATVAIHSLEDLTHKDRHTFLQSLKSIDWTDGALSDDEDLNFDCRNMNQTMLKDSVKQHLRCLVKNLISELNDFEEKYVTTNTIARNEADCSRLWALASPCCCSWSLNSVFRPRIGVKRKTSKFVKCNFDCDNRKTYKKVLVEEVMENDSDKAVKLKAEDEDEEVFATPPSESPGSEEEIMEDPLDLPDTFIYEGSVPSKTDYAVLDAISSKDICPEKYPNIYRWKHLVILHSKSNQSSALSGRNHFVINTVAKKHNSFPVSPTCSPVKMLNKSSGSCDISRRTSAIEPWERIIGPYSPRSSKRASSFMYNNQESPINR